MSRHLAVQASARKIRFVNLLLGKVIDSFTVELSASEAESRQILDDFFKEHSALSNYEDDISLSWSSLRSTLVPGNIFSESSPEEIYRLCYGETTQSEVDYNRIAEHGIVHVYDIPLWIKRYFVLRFPRIVIQHEGTHALRKVMQNAFYLKALLIIHEDHFRLSIVKHNQLEYYGSFGIQSWEDVLYYLLFTLQQKELTGAEGSIELAPAVDASSELLVDLEKNIARIDDLSKMKIVTMSDFLAESQLLCV